MMPKTLRQILYEQGVVIDIETGGRLKEQHPVIQVGAAPLDPRLSPGDVQSTIVPFTSPKLGSPQNIDFQKFYRSLSPWARRQYRQGGAWHRDAANFIGESQGSLTQYQSWLEHHIADPVTQGKWLIGHNINFDVGFLGRDLSSQNYQKIIGGITPGVINKYAQQEQSLYATIGEKAHAAYRNNSAGNISSTIAGYEAFVPELNRALKAGKGGILDSRTFVTASLAYAKRHQLIDPKGEPFTGTTVGAGHFAFHNESLEETFIGARQHTVSPDIAATSRLTSNYSDLSERLRDQQKFSSQNIWESLSLAEKRALRFHEELQSLIAPSTRFKGLVDMEWEIRKQGSTELNRAANRISQTGRPGDITNLQEAFSHYEELRRKGGYSFDLQKMIDEVQGLSLPDLESYVSGAKVYRGEEEVVLFRKAMARAEKDLRPWFERNNRWERFAGTYAGYGERAEHFVKRSWAVLRQRPFTSLTGGFAAVFLGLSAFPGKKDDYNTIEGLKHGWFGQQRAQNTDFGSGYKGKNNTDGDSTSSRTAKKILSSHTLGIVLLTGIGGLVGWRFLTHATPAWERASEKGWNNILRGRWTDSRDFLHGLPDKVSNYFRTGFPSWEETSRLPGRIAKKTVSITLEAFEKTGQSIWQNRYFFGTGLVFGTARGYYQEDDSSLGLALGMAAWDVSDDILLAAGGGSLLRKAGWFGEFFEDPYIQKLMSGTLGYSVGKAIGTVARGHQKTPKSKNYKRRIDPNKHIGLLQHINRNKTNHHKMMGY